MNNYKTDVPVALVFFNRPDTLKEVFESIRRARPSKLFLIQDGAREGNEKDKINIPKCRAIVEDVDWDCEVHKIYSEENLGCGYRIYSGVSEAFKHVDRLVIIEDDIVIGEDMLPFCAEMLERYKDDQRIDKISGMNHVLEYKECPYSYFFAEGGGAIWGWATWKRVWDNFEWNWDCYDDEYTMRIVPYLKFPVVTGPWLKGVIEKKVKSLRRGEKQTSWSMQCNVSCCRLQSRISIVPQKNLISNIGLIGEHSVHSSLNKLPRKTRKVYFGKTFVLERPLKHPKYVISDNYYLKKQDEILHGSKIEKLLKLRMLEVILYRFFPFLSN